MSDGRLINVRYRAAVNSGLGTPPASAANAVLAGSKRPESVTGLQEQVRQMVLHADGGLGE